MNFRMIQAVIECSERSTVERIEENSNDVSRCLRLTVNILAFLRLTVNFLAFLRLTVIFSHYG